MTHGQKRASHLNRLDLGSRNWPAWRLEIDLMVMFNFISRALPCTAWSISKSLKIINGDLPPSSSVTGRTNFPDAVKIACPVGTDPVKDLKCPDFWLCELKIDFYIFLMSFDSVIMRPTGPIPCTT